MSIICIAVGRGLTASSCLAVESIHVFHFNDYPADPPREKATDADRVYPGDGVAPLKPLLRDLAAGGFHVTLSLELFNRKYWSQDPLIVVRTGLEKMKALVGMTIHFGFWILDWVQDDRAYRGFAFLDRDYDTYRSGQSKIQNGQNRHRELQPSERNSAVHGQAHHAVSFVVSGHARCVSILIVAGLSVGIRPSCLGVAGSSVGWGAERICRAIGLGRPTGSQAASSFPADIRGIRFSARSTARLGRDENANRMFARHGVRGLRGPRTFYLLGRGLDAGRPGPGSRAALEESACARARSCGDPGATRFTVRRHRTG